MQTLRLCFFRLCAASSLLLSGSIGLADGLSAGDAYSWTLLRGTLTVHCTDPSRGGSSSAIYACYRPTLDPAESAYFVTSPGGNASVVTLSCLHEDGTKQTKRSNFDAAKGQSTNWFNLWISTVFQRPLLKPGVNACAFELSKKDGTLERHGLFNATVTRGADRECPNRTVWSRDADDCSNGALMCDRYFAAENYCQ